MLGTFNYKCHGCEHVFVLTFVDCTECKEESKNCPDCGSLNIEKLFSLPRVHGKAKLRNKILMGQMSNDINSDMYYKNNPIKGEQKVSEARRLEHTYHKIERMEREGKTAHVDDFDDMKKQIAVYRAKEQAGIEI